MKVDEDILRELVISLEENLKSLNDEYKEELIRMKKAKTVEEVMEIKKDILLIVVNHIPLGDSQCYFCIINDDRECDYCQYAKHHGICSDDNSDYEIIVDLKRKLRREIKNRYYCGEKYEEDDEDEN